LHLPLITSLDYGVPASSFFFFVASFNSKKHDQYGQYCGEKIELTFIYIFSEIGWFGRFH
jgi:hypothetical protein